ncbi:MAG: DUF2142 domain-containing protein [Anaerolineae bacterium]|nr:DUF2142 domain-containing protein [Anaerolineae bacterium]
MVISARSERRITFGIVAAFVFLALVFSSGPIFEGPDEQGHYAYVRHLIRNRALPDVAELPTGQWFHAPLYYALVSPAALIAGKATPSNHEGLGNPYIFFHGVDAFTTVGNDNKNFCIHSRAEIFPYTDSSIARQVHLIRLLSIFLSACTVLTSAAIFRMLWPDDPGLRLIALGFVAFWPQFIYVASLVNNDSLLTLLATLSLWLILRQLRDGATTHGAFLLGILLGLALLTKASALFLVLPVGLAMILDLRRSWKYATLTLLVVAVIAGWWYVRNTVLYGDPVLENVILSKFSHEAVPPGGEIDAIIAHVPMTYQRLWARFGWNSVAVGEPVYRFFDIVTVAALGGLTMRGLRTVLKDQKHSVGNEATARYAIIIAAFVLAWVAMLVKSCATLWYCSQGRYLLPGIAGWAAILSLGLNTLIPRRVRVPAASGSVVVLAIVASICLFGYFLPAYRPLPLPAEIEHPLSLRYEDAAELIGVKSDVVHARPGETIYITLYWRAIEPTDVNLTTYLHSVGSDVVFRDSYPATGNLLSIDWLPGQTWAERYIVIIPDDAEEQAAYPLMAGLYETDTERGLVVSDAEGREVTPLVGQIVINGPPDPFEPDYRFGDVIGLAEPQISHDGNDLQVCLRWVSLAPTSTDYHVFIHALSEGELLAQADFQPKGGLYPTSAWMVGEVVEDCATLDAVKLPPSGWNIAIGLYELPSGERLTVTDRLNAMLPNNMMQTSP